MISLTNFIGTPKALRILYTCNTPLITYLMACSEVKFESSGDNKSP
jgi:hypothetical protein